ncbi:unnamed protein product [Choristocarpus tenellus]
MEEKDVQDEQPDWKVQAERFKGEGNAAFKAGKWTEAVQGYSRAIDLDPEDKASLVYYSNRSAAYLKLGDAKSKALKDAEKCVKLAPEWSKAYSRLGAAQHALGRYDSAIQSLQAGLKLDPSNSSLEEGITAAKEGQEVERRARWHQAAAEREAEEERIKIADAMKAKVKGGGEGGTSNGSQAEENGDPLSSFLTEIKGDRDNAAPPKVERVMNDKYTNQNLGKPKEQMDRLLQSNYKWKNLNCFDVLQLGTDATVEDIKQRYRKLSTLVHPDKRLDMPQARDAFEEVKKAYQVLMEDNRRKTMAATIDAVSTRVLKERQKKIDKGVRLEALLAECGSEAAHKKKACMKEFANIELRRREIDKHKQAQKKRERDQEDEEKDKIKKTVENEKAWAEEDRREKRVGGWRDFQKGGSKTKQTKMWKQEEQEKVKPKFGEGPTNEWKKQWK